MSGAGNYCRTDSAVPQSAARAGPRRSTGLGEWRGWGPWGVGGEGYHWGGGGGVVAPDPRAYIYICVYIYISLYSFFPSRLESLDFNSEKRGLHFWRSALRWSRSDLRSKFCCFRHGPFQFSPLKELRGSRGRSIPAMQSS